MVERKHVCMNCMQDMGQYDMCAYCGWVDGTRAKELYHLTPRTILMNRYEIGMAIGFGGFGVIYHAWDIELGTQVAVKEYYPNGLVNRVPGQANVVVYSGSRREQFDYGKERFLAEARTMAKFSQHANIVNVYDYFEANNTAYIVMEYMDGISLKDYLKKMGGKVSPAAALEIIRPVMEALKAIHAEGVVHRDISPDNIFILKNGQVKVLDFGAARLSVGDEEKTLSVVLKPGYAPPEQYRSKSRQGPFTDIYALGATLYRMLTGMAPEESVDRLVDDQIVLPSTINPEIDKKLENIILKAMAINAALRFKSIEEMEKALYSDELVLLPQEQRKAIERKRKKTAILACSAAAVLVAALVVVSTVFQSGGGLSVNHLQPCSVSVERSNDVCLQSGFAKAGELLKEESGGKVTAKMLQKTGVGVKSEKFAEVPQSAMELDKLIHSLEERDYPLLNVMKQKSTENKWVATGFDMPVIFYNVKLMSLYDIPIPYVEDMTLYNKLPTFEDYIDLAKPIVEVEECAALISKGTYRTFAVNAMADACEEFCNGESVMYLGELSDIAAVQESMPGYYAVSPMPVSYKWIDYITFNSRLYIQPSDDSNKNEAALSYLSYLFSNTVQTEMYITNDGEVPMEKNALIAFAKEKYPTLRWLVGELGLEE